MKTNYLKILFIFTCIITGIVVTHAHDFEVDGIYYNINGTEATVTYGPSYGGYSGSVTIPSTVTYNNVIYSVTAIGREAFERCSELTSIHLPNSITLIDFYAFEYCTGLTNIEIPTSVSEIGHFAFYGCENLSHIIVAEGNPTYDSRNNCNAIIKTASNTLILGCQNSFIPNSVTAIGDYAFKNCSGLTSIEIPNSVTEIGDYSFEDCDGLSSINIPNSVTHIGYSAFAWCEGLTSVSIPSSVETIDFDAFGNCWNIERVDITDLEAWLQITFNYQTSNPLFRGASLFLNGQEIEDLVIPDGVTYINANAFVGCNLRSVTIPNSVKTIWSNAFLYCGANTVTIGTGVQRIAQGAFYGSSLHKLIMMPETSPTIEVWDYYDDQPNDCFSSETYSNACLMVPNSCRENYQNASYWSNFNFIRGVYDFVVDSIYYKKTDGNTVMVCDDETREYYYDGPTYKGNVTVPDSVTYKGITYNVTSVEEYSFCNSNSLTAIVLPNSVERIGYYAFGYCPELKSISFGSGLSSIEPYAFMNCSSINQISSFALTPPVISNRQVFDDIVYSSATLELPRAAISAYSIADYWQDFSNLKTFPYDFVVDGIYYLVTSDNTVSVSYKDTNYNTYSGNVEIPETVSFNGNTYRVTSIGTNSFAYCDELLSITVPNSVTSIGGNAFRGCSALTRLIIPNSVFSIGNSAFKDCSGLTEVIIGSNVYEIGDEAFNGCFQIITVSCLPTTPPMISQGSFANDAFDNTAIVVPKTSLSMYRYADYWGNFSFILRASDFEENGLYYVITGSNQASVTYQHDSYRGRITIPCAINHNGVTYRVTSIEEGAFFRSANLMSVTIPNTILSIGHGAFYHCSGLTDITIPNSIKRIPNSAFLGCSALTSLVIGSSINLIEENAFHDCIALNSIICKANTPPRIENSNCFDSNCYENALLKVPDLSVAIFKSADYWRDFHNLRRQSPFAIGDANGNGGVDISDVTFLIDYLLNCSIELPDENAADINQDNEINITDVTLLIDALLGVTDILSTPDTETIFVHDIPFNMVKVEGGTFMMGAPEEAYYDPDWWKPSHEVTLSPYYIGQTEVTLELWLAVMNNVPNHFKESPLCPVENITWFDCQEFVNKLNEMTGRSFRLPTEAEWEFAARGGNKSHGYKYSGSDIIGEVAWYSNNAPSTSSYPYERHPLPVGLKKANELGLYDMSGNVGEWCYDWNGTYSPEPQTNPTGTDLNAGGRVVRGGSISRGSGGLTVWARDWWRPESSDLAIGLRLAMDETTPPLLMSRNDISMPLGLQENVDIYNGKGHYSIVCDSTVVKCMLDGERIEISAIGCGNTNVILTDLSTNDQITLSVTVTNVVDGKEVFTVNGVQFTMVQVQGGTFMMGATPEQGENVYENERPVHQVTVSNYSIGETQVTQELWIAVMGYNPSYHTGAQNGLEDDFQRPVERVYWRDCQMFVKALNALTGREFRLPTEAEWEFAARGGNKTQSYRYAGSDNLDEVAWYWNTSSDRTHAVGTKRANELGLYDMSGNVWEWCQDYYSSYSSNYQIDPTGPSTGSSYIIRGGGFYSSSNECYLSRRAGEGAQYTGYNRGFRLAL